jgi:small subunit ribosomal protein S16
LPVKMRLHRVGAKHQPSYRIVVTPALTPRDGSYLDQVGFYNPRTDPATIRIDNEKAVSWLLKGVQPTDRVLRLLASVAIDPAAIRRGEPIPTELPAKPERKQRAKKAAETAAQAEAPAGEAATPTAVEAPAEAAEARSAAGEPETPAVAEDDETRNEAGPVQAAQAEANVEVPAAEESPVATGAATVVEPETNANQGAGEALAATASDSAAETEAEPSGEAAEGEAKPARKRAPRKKASDTEE